MLTIARRIGYYGALLGSVFCQIAQAAVADGTLAQVVLKEDAAARAAIDGRQIVFTLHTQADPVTPHQGYVDDMCVAMWQGDTLFLRVSAQYKNAPVYVAPELGVRTKIGYRADKSMIVTRLIGKVGVIAPDRNETIETFRVFAVDPNGHVTPGEQFMSRSLFPERSFDGMWEYQSFELATGRGMKREYFDKVLAEETDTETSMVKARVEGTWQGSTRAVWTLTIDPNADCLVRHAHLCRQSSDSVLLEITSSGAVKSAGKIVCASDGMLVVSSGKLDARFSVIGVEDIGAEKRKAFQDAIIAELDSAAKAGVRTVDFRNGSPREK